MGITYLVARVSTKSQKLERQIRSLLEYCPTGELVTDKYTGTASAFERPEFSKVLKKVKAGDKLVFDEINRMSRREDGFELYEELFIKGVDIVFLKQHHLDTENFRRAIQQQIEFTGNEVADIYIEATNKVLMILAKQQIELAFEQAASEAAGIRRRTAIEDSKNVEVINNLVGWLKACIERGGYSKIETVMGSAENAKRIRIINAEVEEHKDEISLRMWEKMKQKAEFPEFLDYLNGRGISFEQLEIAYDADEKAQFFADWKMGRPVNL